MARVKRSINAKRSAAQYCSALKATAVSAHVYTVKHTNSCCTRLSITTSTAISVGRLPSSVDYPHQRGCVPTV